MPVRSDELVEVSRLVPFKLLLPTGCANNDALRSSTVGDDHRFPTTTDPQSVFTREACTDGVDAPGRNEISSGVIDPCDCRRGCRVVQVMFDFQIDNYLSIGCAVRVVLECLERQSIGSLINMPPDSEAGITS